MKIGRELIPLFTCLVMLLLLAGIMVGSVMAQGTTVATQPGADSRGEIRVLESTEERILLVVDVPSLAWDKQKVNGRVYDTVSVPGWGLTAEAGSPQLPTRRILLGVPLGAEVQVRVLNGGTQAKDSYDVLPAPELVLLRDSLDDEGLWSTPPQFEERYAESPLVYNADAFYPAMVARVAETGFIRHQRVAALDVYPVRYNPVTGKAELCSQIEIELVFSYPQGKRVTRGPVVESQVYEQILQSQLVNYTSAKAWRSGAPAASDEQASAQTQATWPLPSDAYKIPITQDGLYQLTYGQLSGAGLPVDTLDPRTFQVFLNGEEIAMRVVGEDDGDFDPTDYILFYGQGIRHKYATENVYWLTYNQETGRRMDERDGTPSGTLPTPVVFAQHERVEEELKYQNQWPGGDSVDRWYWVYVTTTPKDVTGDVDLMNLSAQVPSATLWVSMWGWNADPVYPDHHAKFYVNDQYVGEHWWDGNIAVQWVSVEFPQSYLISGTNTLKARFPGDTGALADRAMFDRFELDFGHAARADSNQLVFSQSPTNSVEYEISAFTASDIEVYDVTSPTNVARIVNAAIETVVSTYTVRFTDTVPTTKTYLVLTSDRWLTPAQVVLDSASSLHDTSNGADYIVIAYPDFSTAADTLAAHREARGLRTVVVDVVDVYDEFGYGIKSPDAIHDFLQYAFENWQAPAPTYVVLLGDGTYDPKNNLGLGDLDYVPAYLAAVDPWMLETAADNRYVSVSGSDILPDMLQGRLPANTLAEANAMVDKTIAYEQTMAGADWNSHLILVAGEQPDPQGAGNFHDLSEDLANRYVPTSYSASKVYLGTIAGSTCATGAACQSLLVNTINTTGSLFVNYIGHSARNYWSDHVLDEAAINLMTNSDRLPIMLPMTCLDGYFILPGGYQSLSEAIVRAANKGAVASWAPTGLGVVHGHDHLNEGFFEAVFYENMDRLGAAAYAGKLRLYGVGISLEQVEEYTILGDPALRINAPDLNFTFLPIVYKSYPPTP